MFTSGIEWTQTWQSIALFLTGHQHAGENLAAVRARRAALGPRIQMGDALTRNLPKPLANLGADCLAHARCRVVEVALSFPEECQYVLEIVGEVYRHNASCRAQGLSPAERLQLHQAQSGCGCQHWRSGARRNSRSEGWRRTPGSGRPSRTFRITGSDSRSSCFSPGATRQQALRTGVEESHLASQERALLQE